MRFSQNVGRTAQVWPYIVMLFTALSTSLCMIDVVHSRFRLHGLKAWLTSYQLYVLSSWANCYLISSFHVASFTSTPQLLTLWCVHRYWTFLRIRKSSFPSYSFPSQATSWLVPWYRHKLYIWTHLQWGPWLPIKPILPIFFLLMDILVTSNSHHYK